LEHDLETTKTARLLLHNLGALGQFEVELPRYTNPP
jgi:hypothetical protein